VPLEQRPALALDLHRARPLAAVGEEGEAGAIDPADAAVHGDPLPGPEHQRPAHLLIQAPRSAARRGLDPEAAESQVAHGAAKPVELEQRRGRAAILGAREGAAVEVVGGGPAAGRKSHATTAKVGMAAPKTKAGGPSIWRPGRPMATARQVADLRHALVPETVR
jgi:hypothetical protein